MYPIEFYNYWLSLGTLILQVVTIAFFALYFLRSKFPDLEDVADMLRKWGLPIALALTIAGSALTLFYSEVLGIAPCSLCWLQRIFLYPQVVLFAIAYWKKDRNVALYSIALSILGGIV